MNFRGLRSSSADIWFGLQSRTVIPTIFGQKNIPGFGFCTVSKSSGTHYALRESIWCNGDQERDAGYRTALSPYRQQQ